MRRDLTIRCVSTGTLRTDSPDGSRCALRELLLELDGVPARMQIMETRDGGQRTRDCMVEFDRIAVRSRAGHDVVPPTEVSRTPLDWLFAMAESMKEGERRTLALWVRSMDPAALLHATPVIPGRHRPWAHKAEEGARRTPILLSPLPRPRLVAAGA
jgi:hypothetical protein